MSTYDAQYSFLMLVFDLFLFLLPFLFLDTNRYLCSSSHSATYLTFLHLTLTPTEFETMNKIGTIRDQYEWQPATDSSEWAIEEEKLSKVQPLIDFINHAGELKSTKVLFDII